METFQNTPNVPKPRKSQPLKSLAEEKAGVLNPQDTVRTAGERMRQAQANAWPVAEDRKLVGMIGVDPDRQMASHGHDPQSWRVAEVMNRQIVFCYDDEDCETARRIMDENRINHLPVVDRSMRIVGIFSRDEIAGRTGE